MINKILIASAIFILLAGCKKKDDYNEKLMQELQKINDSIDSVYRQSILDSIYNDLDVSIEKLDSHQRKADSTLKKLDSGIQQLKKIR